MTHLQMKPPEVGDALARADGRVEFRRHDRNRGHIATYNEGLAWARGDYTVLLSADDLLAGGAACSCCKADG